MDKSKVPILLLIVLIGLVFVLALMFSPVDSSPPPTPGFFLINTTLGNVTAFSYRDFIELKPGVGISIVPDYDLHEFTFSTTGSGTGNATVLNDLGDVYISSPAYHSIFIYNGTQWTDKLFQLNTQAAANDFQIVGIDNQTGVITRNQFSVNTQDAGYFNRIKSIDNVTGQVTFDTIDFIDTTTCSGTDKVSAINNITGVVTCTTDSGGAGGGIPLPPKKWGELMPISATADTIGLVAGCSILATASYIYDGTSATGGLRSTTAVTDGVNGGIHCTGTGRHVFRGDQNAYMYSKFQENKITTNRIFIGFSSSATHLPNNADTILDAISGAGLCIRTSDTVYQFCSNDGTGAMATASLTTSEDTATHIFEVYTTDAGVTWCGKLDGGTPVCSSTAANIPAVTTRMYPQSTGETDGGATAIIWTQYLWYLQNDR